MLVRTAITTVKANGPKHSVASIKEALFTILLDILNGKQQQGFFTPLKREGPTKREIKWSHPACKGSQVTASKVNTTPPVPTPTPSTAPQVSNHNIPCTLSPPKKLLPTPVSESANILKHPPSPPVPPPPPPVPQTLTADLDPSLTELEEICRQLENSWQEDIECKNLLRAAPELKEEKVTIPPNNSTKTRQLKCSGKTGNSTHTLTHPKARPQKVASRYEEQMDSKDWNQRQQILLNTTCHMPAMALHPLPLILPLHSGTQDALIPSTYDGSQSHSSKDWGGVLM